MVEFTGIWRSVLASVLGGSQRLEDPPDPAAGDDAQYWWLLPGDMTHAPTSPTSPTSQGPA